MEAKRVYDNKQINVYIYTHIQPFDPPVVSKSMSTSRAEFWGRRLASTSPVSHQSRS